MSDFDAALERLVTDPAFRSALAADPAAALAGYRLSPDEWELLTAQVDAGTGGQRQVEQRTSKASLFGLLSPFGGGSGLHDALHGGSSDTLHTGGHAPAAPAYDEYGAHAGLQPASDGGQPAGFGAAFGRSASGDPFGSDGATQYQGGNSGFGATFGDAASGHGHGSGGSDVLDSRHAPANYHTRVDADGDGHWDHYTAVDRGDQGVDLEVDRDGDGHAEFVGHDFDRDGLIDQADTDTNGDGRLDTRWIDDNGDGWLDRRIDLPAPPQQPAGDLGANFGASLDAGQAGHGDTSVPGGPHDYQPPTDYVPRHGAVSGLGHVGPADQLAEGEDRLGRA